jgi:hypothetical protein
VSVSTVTAPWLVGIMLTTVPPGHTAFSVAPVAECAGATSSCEGAKWSTFYGTWVRQETVEQGETRYRTILEPALERAIEHVLCVRLDYSKVEGCLPEPVALDRKTKKLLFGPRAAAAAVLALDTFESGLREDVQVGRGFARKCPKGGPVSIAGICGMSDDGGQGRGPANECGLGQQHPNSAWMVADVDDALRARARAGEKAAQEEVCQTLIGPDIDSVERSFRATLRGLLRSNAHCAWATRQAKMHSVPWDYSMYSLYGTGDSCYSDNMGKTTKRVTLFRKLAFQMKRAK